MTMVRAPLEPGEFDGRKADRTGADDQHVLAGLRRAAIHRVAADGERLDERELVGGELGARCAACARAGDSARRRPPSHMHAEGLGDSRSNSCGRAGRSSSAGN